MRGAYCLIDISALGWRHERAVVVEPFQLWRLKVNRDSSATLISENGNDKTLLT
jgi:hypothetical protein